MPSRNIKKAANAKNVRNLVNLARHVRDKAQDPERQNKFVKKKWHELFYTTMVRPMVGDASSSLGALFDHSEDLNTRRSNAFIIFALAGAF